MSDLELLVSLIAERVNASPPKRAKKRTVKPLPKVRRTREAVVLELAGKLSLAQLELFEGWQKACEKVGVPVTAMERYSYLSDLLAA